MGSHSSKAAKGDVMAQDAAGNASPSKSNGQENGHVKVNGDVSPKADGEVSSLNESGSAEAPREPAKAKTGGGDAIEPAPVAEGEAKPDGAASTNASTKQTPKKKKRFSFKKSFKLSGISFRKAKKETGDALAASSPTEEQQGKAEAAEAEDQSAITAATKEGEQADAPQEEAAAPVEAAAAAPDNQPAAKRQDGSEEPAKEEEQPQQPPSSESQGDVKPDESSESVEVEPSAAADTAAATDAAAEQKEE